MIGQAPVEIAVAVVIEEQRLRRVAGVLESILLGGSGEGAIAVVDVENVASVLAQVVDARYVDVDLPVAVDVGHGDAGFPTDGIGDARLCSDVLELVVAFVAIELVRAKIRGEVEIGEPITIDIADSDAASVVVVEVVDDVEVGALGQIVGEGDTCPFWFEQLEQAWLRGFMRALATE